MKNGLTLRDFWNPARSFSPWFQDVDDMMDRLLIPMTSRQENSVAFNPPVDVEETDTHYLMSFDLPGVSKDDVKIEVVDNQLIVSGERKMEKREDRKNRHVAERYYGSFKRIFTLPTDIDIQKVEASYRDGVLQVAVPKAESSKPRQIKISEGKGSLFSKLIGKTQQNEREVSVDADSESSPTRN